jgi:hypothetical protein
MNNQPLKISERAASLINSIIPKLFSARFISTVLVIGTLCWSVVKCLSMAQSAVADEKVFSLVKEIVMFVLGAFISVVTSVTTLYFGRTDRSNKEDDLLRKS